MALFRRVYYQTSITIQWDLNGCAKHKKHKISISFITSHKHNFLFHFYFFTFFLLRRGLRVVEKQCSLLRSVASCSSSLLSFHSWCPRSGVFWFLSLTLHFLWAANLNFADSFFFNFFVRSARNLKNPFIYLRQRTLREAIKLDNLLIASIKYEARKIGRPSL